MLHAQGPYIAVHRTGDHGTRRDGAVSVTRVCVSDDGSGAAGRAVPSGAPSAGTGAARRAWPWAAPRALPRTRGGKNPDARTNEKMQRKLRMDQEELLSTRQPHAAAAQWTRTISHNAIMSTRRLGLSYSMDPQTPHATLDRVG